MIRFVNFITRLVAPATRLLAPAGMAVFAFSAAGPIFAASVLWSLAHSVTVDRMPDA